jgi:toxin FitB
MRGFETFSVLTRLPPPARRPAPDVLRLMNAEFPATVFLSQDDALDLIGRLEANSVAGGAVYDALVSQAAARSGLPMVSRDARAARLYRRLGCQVELLD